MDRPAHHAKSRIRLLTIAAAGILLPSALNFYPFEELLICWLGFTVFFVIIALPALVATLIYSVAEAISRSVRGATRALSEVTMASPHFHPK